MDFKTLSILVHVLMIQNEAFCQIPDFTPEMEEEIVSFVEATIACREIPGLILSVVHKVNLLANPILENTKNSQQRKIWCNFEIIATAVLLFDFSMKLSFFPLMIQIVG